MFFRELALFEEKKPPLANKGACLFWEMLVLYYYVQIWEKTSQKSPVQGKLLSGHVYIPPLDNVKNTEKQPKNNKEPQNTSKKGVFSMKTRKQFFGFIAMAIIATAIVALPLAGCKDEPEVEQPQKQPDTPRTLSFSTPCTVTIKSDDQFTASEWKTLCDKVVAAIERGYGDDTVGAMAKNGIVTHFTNNTVSAVLLKSATYDVEVKNTVLNTMYFKANGSAIDGISGANFLYVFNTIVGGGSYHLP